MTVMAWTSLAEFSRRYLRNEAARTGRAISVESGDAKPVNEFDGYAVNIALGLSKSLTGSRSGEVTQGIDTTQD